MTVYYYTKKSRRLGQLIHNQMLNELKMQDRGLVRDNFTVLETVNMPAVLIEMGYLSNPTEAKKLGDPAYQDALVKSIGQGIVKYILEDPNRLPK